jgi:hypothetical protein
MDGRRFVLTSMADLAPELRHPVTGRSIPPRRDGLTVFAFGGATV